MGTAKNRLSGGVLPAARSACWTGLQVQAGGGQVQVRRVEVDADEPAVELAGGQRGAAGTGERVEHRAGGFAAGGDAPQRKLDREHSDMWTPGI